MANVAVLGASNNTERYSNKAVKLLVEKNHTVFPVHPTLTNIDGLNVYNTMDSIDERIDTLSVYISPLKIGPLINDIIKLNPHRVILNPGTESDELENNLARNNIPFVKACTLVLLKTGQF